MFTTMSWVIGAIVLLIIHVFVYSSVYDSENGTNI